MLRRYTFGSPLGRLGAEVRIRRNFVDYTFESPVGSLSVISRYGAKSKPELGANLNLAIHTSKDRSTRYTLIRIRRRGLQH